MISINGLEQDFVTAWTDGQGNTLVSPPSGGLQPGDPNDPTTIEAGPSEPPKFGPPREPYFPHSH